VNAADAQGRFTNPDCGTTGLDKFELGRPSRVYYGSGGNPSVWLSNSYSNDGISNAQFQFRNFDSAATLLPGSADSMALSREGGPGYDVPQSLVDNVAGVTDADANDSFLALVDPDYEQPS